MTEIPGSMYGKIYVMSDAEMLTIEGLKAEISKLREALQMAVDRIAMVSQDYPVKYEVLDAAKALGVVPE